MGGSWTRSAWIVKMQEILRLRFNWTRTEVGGRAFEARGKGCAQENAEGAITCNGKVHGDSDELEKESRTRIPLDQVCCGKGRGFSTLH